jgi:hypothetical protein
MKNTQWFYDPNKTFDQNMDEGPYFDHIPELNRTDKPRFDFLGFPIYLPFGIAAGTLPTSNMSKPPLTGATMLRLIKLCGLLPTRLISSQISFRSKLVATLHLTKPSPAWSRPTTIQKIIRRLS